MGSALPKSRGGNAAGKESMKLPDKSIRPGLNEEVNTAPGEHQPDREADVQPEGNFSSGKAKLLASSRWAFSATALSGIDEMDPALGELELLNDRSSISLLQSREDALLEEQFHEHLAAHEHTQRTSPESVGLGGCFNGMAEGLVPGEPVTTEAARTRKQHLAVQNWVKRVRHKELERRARAAGNRVSNVFDMNSVEDLIGEPVSNGDWERDDVSEADPSELKHPSRVNLSSWWTRFEGRNSEYAGLGYSLTISQYARNRFATATASKIDKPVLSSSARRHEQRQQREFQLVEGEEVFLAFEAFPPAVGRQGATGKANSAEPLKVDSGVFEKEVFSIVDTGTTVTILALKKDTVLEDFDAKDRVKIMGFNGSVSSSKGKGTIVGFSRSVQGQRVPFRIPNAYPIQGAPNDLLSVSSLVSQGYSFHFTPDRSYVVTPTQEELDLVQKSGLYWLKWHRATNPTLRLGVPLGVRRVKGPIGQSEDESDTVRDEALDELSSIEMINASNLGKVSPGYLVKPCCSRECQFCNVATDSKMPMSLLHRRCIHWNPHKLALMSKNRAIDLVPSSEEICVCEICKAAKATRKAVPSTRDNAPVSVKPFSRVWTDVKGKVDKDFWGNQYVITFTCEVTRWTCVYFCQRKSQAKDRLREFLQWVKRMGYKVDRMQSDGGGEYTSNENAKVLSEFQNICLEHDIEQNFTAAHTPAQNGISERVNRTLVEHARCLLIDAGLSSKFWSLAVKHVAYCRNRLWHHKHQVSSNVGSSAYQHLHGKPPRLGNLRVFGSDAWKLDHGHRSGSFSRKAQKHIFVGLSANRKGWCLFDPKTRKISTSYHVSFNESMSNRVCALRDFDLRPSKAGPGASLGEERDAALERALYDANADLTFDSEESGKPGGNELPDKPIRQDLNEEVDLSPVKRPHRDGQAAEEHDKGGERLKKPTPARAQKEAQSQEAARDTASKEDHKPVSKKPSRARSPNSGSCQGDAFKGVAIPARRAAIGSAQELDEDDFDFLKTAFDLSLPMVMEQRNPKSKGSSSRLRYEKYKSATCLRDIKKMGGTWQDITWDFARGYVDFSPTAKSSAAVIALTDTRDARPISDSPAAYVTSDGNVQVHNAFNWLTYEESVQQDYAMVALEHLESLSHRAQQLLQKALGGQTLTEYAHCCASRIMIPDPLTVKEAMASEHAEEWKAAMQEEIDTLNRFHCFEVVPRSEALKHGRLVKSKWVFKTKLEADGSVQRRKGRLVAKGFTQQFGTDFFETFSPVFSYSSLRAVLAMAAANDFVLTQWDLKSSFIQQKLDVDHMYLEVPEGMPKTLPDGRPAALHCLQSIYGLRQSSRLLHDRLSKHLTGLGFTQLISDRCVFVRGKGQDQVIVCTWVDDIIMCSAKENDAARESFDTKLREVFEVSPWTSGEADWILNMKVQRDWHKGTVHLSQPAAIEKLATRFGMTGRDKRAPHVPMSPDLKLFRPADEDIVPPSTWDYQSAVGGLLYLALTARPDLAQSVGVLSRFMSCPSKEAVEAAQQVIRYAFGTKDYGITYTRGQGGSPHLSDGVEVSPLAVYLHSRKNEVAVDDTKGDSRLMGTYADADLAGDVGTRKSTSGYAVVLHGGIICWLSKLQSTVALSTAEAETIAGVEAVKQVMHLRLFLSELGQEQSGPSIVYEDNNAAISLAHGKEQSKRSKHYQLKVHFLNDMFTKGVFTYEKVGTKSQLADVFTKSLPRDDFCRYREWMGVKLPAPCDQSAFTAGD
jgi:hypothetical protein